MMRVLLCVSILASATPAHADDDEDPTGYEVWFDGKLDEHPRNDKLDALIEGDTLTVHVDATRLFPDPATPIFELGFAVSKAAPDVLGFYVVGPGAGAGAELLMQPGLCGRAAHEQALVAAKKKVDDAQKKVNEASAADKEQAQAELAQATTELQNLDKDPVVAEDAKALTCARAPDWTLADKDTVGYVCGGDEPLKKLLAQTTWSLVQRRVGDATKQDDCLAEWTLGLDKNVSSVTAEVFNGAAPAEKLTLAGDSGRFATAIPIKANARAVRLTVTFDGGRVATRTIQLKARPRDTHSRLRLQAELLAVNRLRAISFAVALTPVRRKFFTEGPSGCFFGCAATLSAVLRIAGDDKTVVQFGGAVGINLVRAFQVNGGVLFGTSDTNTAWRIERNWFVGVAIDPIILSEAITSGSKKD